MAAYDDLNTTRIFSVSILSVVVVAVTVLAVQVVYYWMLRLTEETIAEQSSYRRQNAILEDQTAQISAYDVDEETGNVVIPIDQAIELVAKERSSTEENDETGKADET